MASGPSRLVAYVREDLDEGPILLAEQAFAEEISMAGSDISDHDFPPPEAPGLWLFEGWLQIGPEPDPDVAIVGEWRRLDHWEMCRMRHGMSPW